MKRFIYSALACGAVLSLASCASDEPLTPGNGDGVQLTISLPDAMMTRASNAFGDGLDAVNLTYAVYNSKGTLIMSETKANFFDGTNLTNTLSLDLLNGETYNIIFWADAFGAGDTESPFIFSTDDKTVTVNYLKMGANSEKYDAFYASDNLTVNGPVSKTIKLYRPFAQINFGTNDLDKPAVTKEFGEDWANLQTTYTVSGLANTLNLATGAVSQNTDYGTSYSAAVGIPTGQAFPKVTVNGQAVTGLNYLQMDYILAGKGTNDIAEFDLEIVNSASNKVFNTIKVPNAPYQANYRTNIYGQLLTTTNDFVVEIVPIFETPDYNPLVWNGVATEEPAIVDGVMNLYTPAQVAGLAKMVNEGNQLRGVTIKLNNDIDLGNAAWTPIGQVEGAKYFAGTFDGQNHTIRNLNAVGKESAGLFGALVGTVKNLKIENATVSSNHFAGTITGWLQNTDEIGTGTPAKVENCFVKGATVTSTPTQINGSYDNGDKAGGLVGYGYSCTIIGNTGIDLNVKGYRNLGGIIGYLNTGAARPSQMTGNQVNNVTITQDMTHNYKPIKPGTLVGGQRGDGLTPDNFGPKNTVSGLSYVFQNWTANDFADFTGLTLPNVNITVDNFNCNTVKMVLFGNNVAKVTNSTFYKSAENNFPTNDLRQGIDVYIKNYTQLIIDKCDFQSSWQYSVLVQTDNSTPSASVKITNSKFNNWCRQDEGKSFQNICTAVKIFDIANICQTEADRLAYAKELILNSGNTFDAEYLKAWGLLNLTQSNGVRFVYNMDDVTK